MNAADLQKELDAYADPEKAAQEMRFFKCGPGGYAEGDVFIGVPVPFQRKLAKKYRDLPLPEVETLLKSGIHEHRQSALLVLVESYRSARSSGERRQAIVDLYLRNTRQVNNWDLVDTSAHYILGPWMLDEPDRREILYRLAGSGNLWEQRIAVLTTFAFIRAGQFEDTLAIADLLLHHSHDLIHKAVGWMLREVGNREREAEEEFLLPRYQSMPRTMLRYAIEKFPEELRRGYLKGLV